MRAGWGRTQDATFTENFTDEPDYFAHSSYESADRGARADGRVAPDRALTDAPPGRCKPLYGERGRASRRAATGLRTTANEAPAFNSSATKMISIPLGKMIDARVVLECHQYAIVPHAHGVTVAAGERGINRRTRYRNCNFQLLT